MRRGDTFLLGVMLGLVIGILAILGVEGANAPVIKKNAQIKEMITQCEATLPRNETCELVAVPARKKEV